MVLSSHGYAERVNNNSITSIDCHGVTVFAGATLPMDALEG
jgi:hypothetical protein